MQSILLLYVQILSVFSVVPQLHFCGGCGYCSACYCPNVGTLQCTHSVFTHSPVVIYLPTCMYLMPRPGRENI